MDEESEDSRSGVTWLSSGTELEASSLMLELTAQNSVTVRWKMDVGVNEFGNAELN